MLACFRFTNLWEGEQMLWNTIPYFEQEEIPTMLHNHKPWLSSIPLTFRSVSRRSLLLISWGSLQPTLALGNVLGILLQITSFHHIQNCVANNKVWAVFVRKVFVSISNGNFQQNVICILLSSTLLMYIIYLMGTTIIISFGSILLLHEIIHLKITIWRKDFAEIVYKFWMNSTIYKR